VRLAVAQRVLGSEPTPLKNEYGARLATPTGEIVETKAMGLGTMAPTSSLYRSTTWILSGSMSRAIARG
jgi:hypothetical protein